MLRFLDEKLRSLGTAACPPYHLAIVVGGTSAEYALKTAKYASRQVPRQPADGGRPAATPSATSTWRPRCCELTREFGIGAQFGGKYFCHDVRVVRLPRHGASCPVAIAVSCSADRQALAKITAEGVFLEQLETDPARFLPEVTDEHLRRRRGRIDLNRPMAEIRAELSQAPGQDPAVADRPARRRPRHRARQDQGDAGRRRADAGRTCATTPSTTPGPAKTPEGYASGSFGPTTAGRMDTYVDQFQEAGGSFVMLAKGNRSAAVTDACQAQRRLLPRLDRRPGGPAGQGQHHAASRCWTSPSSGMEAVWRIEVEDFPAFVVVDDKGNDFFAATKPVATTIGRTGLSEPDRPPRCAAGVQDAAVSDATDDTDDRRHDGRRTPGQAWRVLAGNDRFAGGRSTNADQSAARRAEVAQSQHPFALVFGCGDSRVSAEIVFDQGLGRLFVVRTAGHVVDSGVLGSVEFGVGVLHLPAGRRPRPDVGPVRPVA